MRELSIQEKAKRYDEAIERLRNAFYDNSGRMCEDYRKAVIRIIEPIFPELKESEDERIVHWIRKELEDKYVTDNIVNNEMADKALAWLEKQGDKKDKLIKEISEYKVKYTQEVLGKYMSNKDDERLRKTTIAFLKEFANKGYENAVECIDWLENQDEPNPDNKVEPKFRIGDIIRHKKHGFTCKIIAIDTEYRLSDCMGTHLPFDSQDAYELVEQNPAWSEEDEKQARQIERIVHDDGCTQKLQKQIADWFKSLKDRYTWKPSDEQMKQLGWIAEQNKDNMIGKELMTLYNDLKKLKG